MNPEWSIRPARIGDETQIFDLIRALADYEHLSSSVTGNAARLAEDLFGERPAAEALVVEREQRLIAFALFFGNYSTFLTQPGLYLEDIFVLPEHRGRGVGKALLAAVARLAAERGAGRLEWSVLDWNESAIAFYEALGATVMPDWRICRVTGERLRALGSGGSSPPVGAR